MTKRAMIGILGVCVALAGGLRAAEIAGPTTLANLQTAYNGKSNAKARYEAFAARADEEGYRSVAALFRAAAKSEGVHAAKQAAAITKLGAEPKAVIEKPEVLSTRENLEAALKGEGAEATQMSPAFFKQAELDKNEGAVRAFKGAMAAEEGHTELYQKALNNLDNWKAAGKEFIVCQICGYTSMDMGLKKCPVCASPRSKFDLVK